MGCTARLRLRLSVAVAALLPALLAAGCGEVWIRYDSGHCGGDPRYAVVVAFQARGDGQPVALAATGVVRDGSYSEAMVPVDDRRAPAGRSFELAGGRERAGVYDVEVETEFGEILNWYRVQVPRDFCGPYTVYLRGSVARY